MFLFLILMYKKLKKTQNIKRKRKQGQLQNSVVFSTEFEGQPKDFCILLDFSKRKLLLGGMYIRLLLVLEDGKIPPNKYLILIFFFGFLYLR